MYIFSFNIFYLISYHLIKFLKGSRDNEKKYFSTDDPNDLSKKIINAKTTLIKRFKADGFDYEKFKFEKILSYRDIEKTLISFQTFFSVIYIIAYYIYFILSGNFIIRIS